jgi:hypothetical protein
VPGSGVPGLGVFEDVVGGRGAALWTSGLQPVSMTMVADTMIAGQIRFGFTSKLLTCW